MPLGAELDPVPMHGLAEAITGLQLEKGYPDAGSTEADGTDGLRSPLFSDFRKANAPTCRGICF